MFGRALGGIEQALVDYCEALRFSGHDVHAVIHPKAEIRPVLKKFGIPVHVLSNLGAWDPLAALKLRGLLKRLSPDVCIAHGNRALSLLSKAGKDRRIVGVMHNYEIHYESLRFVFYPTQDLLRHMQAGMANPAHSYHIPNLVRAPASEPIRHWHEPPVIGAMGRFVAKKGFAVFIEALFVLKARGIAFRAVLAGSGEEAQALSALAAQKGLNDVLHFTGWVSDKQAFFDSVDIFCLPSHHEPFGIVLLEAMAQALPVVAAASEGPSEILRNGIDGMLIPINDAAALASALASLLSDRQHAELLARNAYDTVKNRYDLPVVAHKLDLALRSLARL